MTDIIDAAWEPILAEAAEKIAASAPRCEGCGRPLREGEVLLCAGCVLIDDAGMG